jgi:DNA-binding response OmpR family regulator
MPTIRVLVVDDHPDSADSLAAWLAAAGFDALVARDGEEALIRAARWHPKVGIIDLGLHKLDGFEVAGRLRTQPWASELLLIAYTGWSTMEDRRNAYRAGFDYYVIKPVEPEELLRMICLGTATFSR